MKHKDITCKQWTDCGIPNGGCCSIDKYKEPSVGVCLNICKNNTQDKTVDVVLPSKVSSKMKPRIEKLHELANSMGSMDNDGRAKTDNKIQKLLRSLQNHTDILVVNLNKLHDEDLRLMYASCQILTYNNSYFIDTSSACWKQLSKDKKLRKVEKKGINWKNIKTSMNAMVTGKHISKEEQLRRLQICYECELFQYDKVNDVARCAVCACKLKGDDNKIMSLSSYEETDTYGCKHPTGSKWSKINGN